MTNLAKNMSTFLREHLPNERRASFNTCDAYAYTFQLLVRYAAMTLKLSPSKITIEHLSAELIVDFLNHLEHDRKNSIRTRNARCAGIKAFFKFLEYREPTCIEQSQRVQSIPQKKTDTKIIVHLTEKEMQAILDAPDNRSYSGIRDSAMISLCFACGLRVSELTSLQLNQVEMQSTPLIKVMGKGRKERVLPLWKETATGIKAWIAIRPSDVLATELFLNSRGKAMSRSGFEYVLAKHVKTAAQKQPSLINKKVSPHVLRHTIAMITLKATHDIRKVSLWLGHANVKSTEVYLQADPSEKLEMLMEVAPLSFKPGKFKVPDKLMAMLKSNKKM